MKRCLHLCLIFFASGYLSGQPDNKNKPEYQNISLKEAIEIGLKNNPEIQSARESFSAAKGRFWREISPPQPEVSLSHEYIPLNSGFNNYNESTVEIRQSFEFPTNYFLKGRIAGKEEEISSYRLKIAETRIVSQIKSSYFKVLAKQYQSNSAEEYLLISEDFLKKAEIKQNVGEGTILELLTAKVQHTEATNNVLIAKNELTATFAELSFALGSGNRSAGTNFRPSDSLVFTDYQISPEKIYASYEETNPQVQIARLETGKSSAGTKLAWSSLLPNISLAYFKQTRDGDSGFYGASLGISVPLWFMFEQRGAIQEAGADQARSESEFLLIKNETFLKLKTALIDHENALRQVKLYMNDILPQSEEIYRTAKKSYDAGELTYLEYLQAKQILINSRNNYIASLLNHHQSVFRIEEIIGQNISD